jgi:hypothetical protein
MPQSHFVLIISFFLNFNTPMIDNCAKDTNRKNNVDNTEGFAVWLVKVRKGYGGFLLP